MIRPAFPLWLAAACLGFGAEPARAQMSPPPGVLRAAPADPTWPTAQHAPRTGAPKAAPVAPVQQVAPFYQPPANAPATAATGASKSANAKPKPPVVHAPAHSHAQRPPGTPATAPAPPPAIAPPATPPPAVPPPPSRPVEAVGSVTGNPLPRWAALRSDEVNLRRGPGTRFPIDWLYHRRDLPVRILRENDVWRLIEDQDGIKGWVHQATLVGHRGFALTVPQATLRRSPSDESDAVAYLKQGVVGRLRSCEAKSDWCEVQAGDYRGYLRRSQFYGSNPGEAVGN